MATRNAQESRVTEPASSAKRDGSVSLRQSFARDEPVRLLRLLFNRSRKRPDSTFLKFRLHILLLGLHILVGFHP